MKLSSQDVAHHLPQLPLWQYRDERGGVLLREFKFHNFAQAFGFMTQVALYAEQHNHHPEWFNVYNRVTVTLTTHDVQGVSERDLSMARLMDQIAQALAQQDISA